MGTEVRVHSGGQGAGGAGKVTGWDVLRAAGDDVCASIPSCCVGCAPVGNCPLSQAWRHRIGSQLLGRIKSSRAAGAVE